MSASQRILDFIDADAESVRVTADFAARGACKADLDAFAVSLAGAQRTNAALTEQVTALQAQIAALTKPVTDTVAVPGYRLLVNDNFDGAAVDTAVWDVKNKYAMNGRDDVSMAANVSVVDGCLRNTMRKQAATTYTGETRQITTGNVWLKQKLPNQFKAQFRVRVPWQSGCWPGSLWFTGAKSGAELDVYEVFPAQKPNVKVTLHSRPYGATHILAGVSKAAPTLDGFVKVDLEKLTRSVKVWWDDALIATFDPASKGWDAAYWEDPTQVWSLWYNLQSGGAGGKVDAGTDWTKTVMDLDYLKIWVPA